VSALGPAALLADLVAIPSPSGAEEASADYLAAAARRLGLDCERVGASLLCALGSGAPTLFLNTHHDTVPVGEGWSGDPHDGTWRLAEGERRLTARGANDAKASVAAMLCALFGFAESRARTRGTLLLGISACEETNNSGMTALLARLAERGLRPDGGVTGEPTGLEVVRAQSGLCVLEARWTGRACHAAHVARVPHANALLAAARALAPLPDFFELSGRHPLLGASTLVPTVLKAGERHNAVPDLAIAVFDGRIAPPHGAADCAALLERHLHDAAIHVRSERLKAVETAADHPLVAAALAATGRNQAIGSATMSDMALLAGLPVVKCGPGETARSHTPNEFLLERELLAGVAAYSEMIPRALEALR
jgi:acetylornithine deacetylase